MSQKPTDCRCSYPTVVARNMHGHDEDCPAALRIKASWKATPQAPQQAASVPAPAQDTPAAPEGAGTGTDETGRALDAAVAREVFGRRIQFIEATGGLGHFTADRDWLEDDWLDLDMNCAVPEFSAGWSAMRLVVKELNRRGWDVDVSYYADGECQVNVWVDGESEAVLGATGPEAICRAALQAVRSAQGKEG